MGKINLLGMTVLAALLASGTAIQADVLYYGGDPSVFVVSDGLPYYNATTNVLKKFPNGVVYQFSQVFDNVTVPVGQTWTVTSLSSFIAGGDASVFVPDALWEIRTDLTTTSKGTLLYSGTAAAAETTFTPMYNLSGNGWPGGTWDVPLSSPVVLEGGQTYWINVTPTSADYNIAIAGSTNNFNSVGTGHDDYSIWWFYQTSGQEVFYDHSLAVIGTATTVPEVATFGMLAVCSVGLLSRRRTR